MILQFNEVIGAFPLPVGALAFTVSTVPLAIEIRPVVARSLLFGTQLGFQGGDPFLEGGNVRLVIRWLAPGCRVCAGFPRSRSRPRSCCRHWYVAAATGGAGLARGRLQAILQAAPQSAVGSVFAGRCSVTPFRESDTPQQQGAASPASLLQCINLRFGESAKGQSRQAPN
jgi:hypothetical protein